MVPNLIYLMKVAEIRNSLATSNAEDKETDPSFKTFLRVLEHMWSQAPFNDNWHIPVSCVFSDWQTCLGFDYLLRQVENKLNQANPELLFTCELGQDLGIDDGLPYYYQVIIIRRIARPAAL